MDKEKIIETASRLIRRYGPKRVTMDDICRSVPVSKKVLYEFFSDKDELLQEFMEWWLRSFDTELNELTSKITSPREKLEQVNRSLVNEVLKYNPGVITDLERYYRKSNTIRLSYREQLRMRLQDIIEEGQHLGVFRKDLDTTVLSEFRLREIETLWSRETFNNRSKLQREQEQLLDVFLSGIAV